MTTIARHDFHTFSWIDLNTTDLQSAMVFYGSLLDWSFEEQIIDGNLVYTMVTLDGRQVAGLAEIMPEQKEQGVPPFWNTYICVEDVRAAVERCTTLGGRVLLPPMDVFAAGSMAMLADPQGAVFSLWQPKEHAGMQVVTAPGSFMWAELNAAHGAEAQAFYTAAFGWNTESDDNSEGYTLFTREAEGNDRYLAGMIEIQPEWGEVPPHWSVYFEVADIDGTLQKALELGASKITDVIQIPQGRFAVLKDPQGAVFTAMESNKD